MERSTWTDDRLDDMVAGSNRRDMFHGAIALFGSQAALFAVLVVQAL